MLRKMILLTVAAVLVAGVATAGETAWFDMDNCSMCTNISNRHELMGNITWEQHNIEGGIVSVTTVEMKYIEDYRTAHASMVETSMKLQSGEKMEFCGSCSALGMCLMKGVDQQYVETLHGDVWIITSENAEVAAELQAWAKRNKDEMAKAKKS